MAEPLSQEVIERLARYKHDPWEFLRECVFTQDPVDKLNPIKAYPADLAYLKFLVRMWQRKRKLAVPKSRRMTVSWTFIALALWDCIFHGGRNWALVSKKEDDSAELLKRAEFIFKKIPVDRIPRELLPKLKNDRMMQAPPTLVWEYGDEVTSQMQGFPQGADQLRQFGFSGIFGDECAFWEEAQAFYSGASPTIEGGGGMYLVSSRSPGFFKKIVFDKINHPTDEFPEVPPAAVRHPMEGIDLWDNPENGFTVVELHYTANPAKRGAAWREAVRKSMPVRDFMMEYEKSWQTFEGMPVFADFNPNFHVAREPLTTQLGLPLILGWDFGLTPACVVAQLQEDRLLIFREYTAKNMGIVRFANIVMASLRLTFPQIVNYDSEVINFIDPAGFQKAQTNESTCAQCLRDAGFRKVSPGPVNWEPRRQAVESFLVKMTPAGAAFQIDETLCPILVAGFKGGYRYADSVAKVEPDNVRPIKDVHSHPADALQYLCGGIRSLPHMNYEMNEIPTPAYGFQRDDSTPKEKVDYGRRIR